MVVAHNIMAMNAQRQFNIVDANKKRTTEKLSSGYRINRAADDAAGLSISEKMRSQIRGLDKGSDNCQDGVSLLQVADGALAEVTAMLHRITQLSIQSANDTNTVSDRAALQAEINQLMGEINGVAEKTHFNTQPVFANNGGMGADSVSNISTTGTPIDDSIKTYDFTADATGISVNGEKISFDNIKNESGDVLSSLSDGKYTVKKMVSLFHLTSREQRV